jgi:hypothetical protein
MSLEQTQTIRKSENPLPVLPIMTSDTTVMAIKTIDPTMNTTDMMIPL